MLALTRAKLPALTPVTPIPSKSARVNGGGVVPSPLLYTSANNNVSLLMIWSTKTWISGDVSAPPVSSAKIAALTAARLSWLTPVIPAAS